MPPKKKYILSTTVRWSRFEVALFQYLLLQTKRSMNDILRQALRQYVRNLPDFDSKTLPDYVEGRPMLETPRKEREMLKDQLDTFLGSFEYEAGDLFSDKKPKARKAKKRTARDFDEGRL